MYYLLFYKVAGAYVMCRESVREAHLKYVFEAHQSGALIMAGALANPAEQLALSFRGDSRHRVEEFARHDPYVLNGLVEEWWIREWHSVIPVDAAAFPGLDSRTHAESYRWGDGCLAWRFLARPDLSINRECVPPGAAETAHTHFHGRQYFYILDGVATLELGELKITFHKGEGVEVPPGISHRFVNESDALVDFLVISSPGTLIDRVDESE